MLKFKEGVKGFIYDLSNDQIIKVFNRELSAEEAILIMEVINNGNVLFEEEEVINEWFTVESEEDLLDDQLSMVLDWID